MSFFRKPPVFSRGMEVKTQLELEAAKSRSFFPQISSNTELQNCCFDEHRN